MNNLAHHDTSKRHIRRELNLARALDEDTRVFSLFSTGPDSCFWEFLPSSVALGIFVFFLIFVSLVFSVERLHCTVCSYALQAVNVLIETLNWCVPLILQ